MNKNKHWSDGDSKAKHKTTSISERHFYIKIFHPFGHPQFIVGFVLLCLNVVCVVFCAQVFVFFPLFYWHWFTAPDYPLLTFLKCRNILNRSSSPVYSGIRLYFSLCSVLLTNVCLLVICLRDIVLKLLISPLVTFLKCRYSLNHYRYLIFIFVLVVILLYT